MTDAAARTNSLTAIVAALLQVWTTWAALVLPAGEYGPRSVVWMSVGLDAGLAVIFAIIAVQFVNSAPDVTRRGIGIVASAIVVVLSLVQLAIRFTGDHGWWTGHLQ